MNEAVLTIEGPRFPTKSESLIFRILSAEMINMTTYLESALARERGMHHSNRGMVIDYENWKEDSKPVSQEKVKEVMENNSSKVKEMISKFILKLKTLEGWVYSLNRAL